MNALLRGAALDRANVQNGARNQEQFDICCSHGFVCWYYSRGVAIWRRVTGWKMADVSRQRGALIFKSTNVLDQITVFWDVSSCSL